MSPCKICRSAGGWVLIAWVALGSFTAVGAQPEPGDIFREYLWLAPAGRQTILDPNSWRGFPENPVNHLVLDDLAGALRVEMYLELWGGHPGTTNKRVRFNDGEWIQIPEPAGIPGTAGRGELAAECYQYYSYTTVPIPLATLQQGENSFQFNTDGQVCFDFGWGQWIAYGVVLRVYYGAGKEHPNGHLTHPLAGTAVGDTVHLEAHVETGGRPVEQVDFIGRYEDFDYEGNGQYRQWHYTYRLGKIQNHLGSATAPPYSATWTTQWVPDQDEPVELALRLRDDSGLYYMAPETVQVQLQRQGRSTRLYKPYDIPGNWQSRSHKRHACKVYIGDDLSLARGARLVLASWNGRHGVVGLNEEILASGVGQDHRYGLDAIDVPLELLRFGLNRPYSESGTEEHGIEVMWPGIALLVQYEGDPEVVAEDWVVWDGGPGSGWQDGIASVASRPTRVDGVAALEVEAQGRWRLVYRAAVPQVPYGYGALRFAYRFEGGDPGDFDIFVNDRGVQLARQRQAFIRRVEGRSVEFVPTQQSRLEANKSGWQVVDVPLPLLETSGAVEWLGFSGETTGTFYLGPVSFVVRSAASTQVVNEGTGLPQGSELGQNFPNPFNSGTTIPFYLGQPDHVELTVFNLLGQRLLQLADGPLAAGAHALAWDGRDAAGRAIASGLYLYRLRVGEGVQTRRLVLAR
ncbi:MAG: T9SS type A sorting domain-containing protein [Candidatus Latescibacteria bacterium]|nr:T9SS type A sorting domain-containing protein [Candidatus Latescibacterota bacterium]